MKYTVKSGDTISKIARDTLKNMKLWPQIARMNGITPPYIIRPGQVLTLPDANTNANRAVTRGAVVPSAPTGNPAPHGTRPIPLAAGFNYAKWLPFIGVAILVGVLWWKKK